MVDLSLLQSVSYIAGALGVCIAAVYYIMVLRTNQRSVKATLETRQAQLLMSLYQKWSEPEFWDTWNILESVKFDNYDDFASKFGPEGDPEFTKRANSMGAFFEGLGVLVKRGFIDATLVDDLMSLYIVSWWQKFGPLIRERRIKMNSPTIGEYQEYLYDVIYGIWMKQHPEAPKPLSIP